MNLQIPEFRKRPHSCSVPTEEEMAHFATMFCRYGSYEWTCLVLCGWKTVGTDEKGISLMSMF
jgi:hypothetical protein